MRIAASWKDGGALGLLPQTFVMMLLATATLVSAESEPITSTEGGGGGMTCSKCDVKEDDYRGPTWAYPCMNGYQGPKPEDAKCDGASGCFRRLYVYGGKKVVGKGGCFDFSKKECIEKVTKVKFNENGCIPETAIEPPMMVDLKKDCALEVPFAGKGGGATPAAAAKRRRREAEAEEGEGIPKGVICVCEGTGCNNQANGMGRNADAGAVHSTKPMSSVWIGVISGVSLIGGSLVISKRA